LVERGTELEELEGLVVLKRRTSCGTWGLAVFDVVSPVKIELAPPDGW
jgi:hypothetical protein